MKTYKIIVSQEARESLKAITDYIRRKESDTRAQYVRKELLKAVDRLESLPNSHPIIYVSEQKKTYRYLLKWQ